MTEKLNTNPEAEEQITPAGDFGKVGVLAAELRESRIESAREDVKYWSSEYKEIELAFTKHEMKSLGEFELWEGDAEDAFSQMEKAEKNAEFKDRYEKDYAEKIAKVKPDETIEAKAGDYYEIRNNALIEAVRRNENEAEREADLTDIYKLHQLVAGHILACMDFETRRNDPMIYNSNRRIAHNQLIRGLNKINHIAEKYGEKRLVFRDFIPNDFVYDSTKDHSSETNARAEYDRSCVEAYVRNAFSRDFEKADSENKETPRPERSLTAMFHESD